MTRRRPEPRWLCIVALLSLAGCYRPNIPDGSLQCGPSGLCPDGYVCNVLTVCAKIGGSPPDAGGGAGIFSGALGQKDLTGLSGVLECSTKTGDIVLNPMTTATPIVTAPMSGFQRVDQVNGPTVAIWSFQSLHLPAGVTVHPSSDSDAIPIFATATDLTMEGTIDWRGFGGFGGRANEAGATKNVAAAAGGQAGTQEGGGGGAGHSIPGTAGSGAGGGAGGVAYGVPELVPLYAGSGGGGGGGVGGRGGPGAGGVALLAKGDLTISGFIDLSGTDGFSGGSGSGGGGGGGSGGGMILSGTHVTLAAGHSLLARGGAGAAGSGTGSTGGAGANGRIWIGGDYTVGNLVATPTPTFAPTALTNFPSK